MKTLKNILLFLFSIIIVSTSLYFYIYKGFISIYEDTQDKIEYKEVIKEYNINEKTIEVESLFYKQLNKEKHQISKLITDFIENKELTNISIDLSLKKEGIVQVNNLFDEHLFEDNTDNNINIDIKAKNDTDKNIYIQGNINDYPFTFQGIYNIEDSTIVITKLDIASLLTLFNYNGFNNYINDGFDIKYNELIGKKIKLEKNILSMIDYNIPKIEENDLLLIINNIEEYINFNNNNDKTAFNYVINNEKDKIQSKIRNYIMSNKIGIGQKQSLMNDVIDIINILDKTGFFISDNKLSIYNQNTPFFFDFDIELTKDGIDTFNLAKNIEIDEDFTYGVDELYKIFLIKNKLLVKYINGEDLLFLTPTIKQKKD